MIIKLAFRNLIRLPWRTVLYFSIVFFIIIAITASLFVYSACLDAKAALDENYIFVASLVTKEKNGIVLADVSRCLEGNEVLAFNVTMSEAEGVIPGGESMLKMPSTENKGEPVSVWMEQFGCDLLAVENLSLVYPFFSGECKITDGTGLTADGYSGETAETVIPWWLAEKYDIAVGDKIVRRYYSKTYMNYNFHWCKVVGIYKAETNAEPTLYPAYIPLAVAEFDYGKMFSRHTSSADTISIDRADFILSGRDSFAAFVKQAETNGLSFQKAEIIFNNSTYDVLVTELDNINMIAMLVLVIVSVVGVSVLIFFTVYLCNSRKREKTLLVSLGMPGRKVGAMIATELIIMTVTASLLGFGAGRLASGAVCRFVNDTVLERASASEMIQRLSSSAEFDNTMPLERNMKIEISVDETRVSSLDVDINYLKTPKDGEVGISRHTYYYVGKTLMDGIPVKDPMRLVGITDIDMIKKSISFKDFQNSPNYYEQFLYAYVSENSPYIPDAEKGRTVMFVGSDSQSSFASMSAQILSDLSSAKTVQILVIGTYEENEHCSGSDILVTMDGYNKAFTKCSITDYDGFYFERIGEIISKGGEADGNS